MERVTMTVSEFAKYLGIGLNKAYEIINSGEIPHLKIGRKFKIPKKGIDEWIEKMSSIKKAI